MCQPPVKVLSLAEQPSFPQRPGAERLGMLLLRFLNCELITATLASGRRVTDTNKRFAHLGTAVNASVLPVTPFNNDGGNGADLNNYALGYYTDSLVYLSAIRRALRASWARIDFVDTPVSNTTIDRHVSVDPRELQGTSRSFGWSASGRVPDVRKQPTVVPYIANWWSVSDSVAGVLSDNVTGQAATFQNLTDPAQAVTIKPTNKSQVLDLFDSDAVTADAIVLIGLLPETSGTDMVVTRAGTVKG